MGCIYRQVMVCVMTKSLDLGKLQHKFEAHSAQVLDVDWKNGALPCATCKLLFNLPLSQEDIMVVMYLLRVRQIAQSLSVLFRIMMLKQALQKQLRLHYKS